MIRFLQELLTHFDLNNVHWRPPRSAEGYAWLSTHPVYTAWTENWNRDSTPSSALFLQCDSPKTRRKFTDLAHYLAQETPTIWPRPIVAKFSFAEHTVKDKHAEAVLAAFAFQILCLQPTRFKPVRHMIQGPPGPGRSVSDHLETILKGIAAGASEDPAELILIVDGLDLVAENGPPLVETLMEIQASASVGLLFTQLVHPSPQHSKGEVVVTNFDYFKSPIQSTTGLRARFDLTSGFKHSKRRSWENVITPTRSKRTTALDPTYFNHVTIDLSYGPVVTRSRALKTVFSRSSQAYLRTLAKGKFGFHGLVAPATRRAESEPQFDAPSPETGPGKKPRSDTHDSTSAEARSWLEISAASPVAKDDSLLSASGSHDEVWDKSLASPDLSLFREVLSRRLGRHGGPSLTRQYVALEELPLRTDSHGYTIIHHITSPCRGWKDRYHGGNIPQGRSPRRFQDQFRL